jgi:hypothetical protein
VNKLDGWTKHDGPTCLVDASLLPCNLRKGLPKNTDVINAKSRDARDDGARDDVGTVVATAYSDFQDRGVNLNDDENRLYNEI